MRIGYAQIVVAALAMSSGGKAATPSGLEGVWGAPGANLTVGPDGAVLEQDCADGRFSAVRLDARGRFRAPGAWAEHAPGPQAADEGPGQGAATFEGKVEGDTLVLTITRPGQPVRTLTLAKGKRAKLIRCF